MAEPSHDPHLTSQAPPRPRALTVVLAALAVEILLLVVAGFAAVADAFRGGNVPVAIALALLAWGVAAALVLSGRGLLRGRRGARSPAFTWQVFQVVVGVTLLQGEIGVVGIALVVLGVVVAIGLLLPAVVEATTRDARPAPR